jgi:transposase
MNKFAVAGVEVSADVLVVALDNGQLRSSEFPNTAAGHQQLLRWLGKQAAQVRLCMESTGLYGLDAALVLQQQPGVEIMVANPRSVRHFGCAMMQRSKTDPIDARLLAEYAQRMPFQAWQPPSRAGRQLCALARAIHQLTEINSMQKNQLHAAGSTATTPKIVLRELERSLANHQRSIQRLTRQALQLIASDPQLRQRFHLLLSFPGIAETSALQLLGELVLLAADCNVRQWVAYAGLDPRQYTSGKSVEKKVRISKVGNRHLRRALFMPVLVAVRCNSRFRAYYHHLLSQGKLKMVALVAAMRKLLHGIYGVFQSLQPFDADKLFSLPTSTPAHTAFAEKRAC